MSRAGGVVRLKRVVPLPKVYVDGHDGHHAECERQQDTLGALFDELRPVPAAEGEINTHARYEEQQRNTPYIEQGHRTPERRPGTVVGDKANHHAPRLEASSDARRVGKECVSTWRSRCSPYHEKK